MIPRRSIPLPRPGPAALLACALALGAAGAAAAPAGHRALRKPALPTLPALADFDRLSGARARTCATPADPHLAVMGQPTLRQCAWSGRLEMQYWHAIPAPAGACLPPAAIAWQRLAGSTGAAIPAWNAAWSGQALVVGGPAAQSTLAVWRAADGAWSAVLWRWRPAPGSDTRTWEAGHWNAVLRPARALTAANPAPPSTPMLQAWLDATGGKPRALDRGNWRWVAQQTCLSMQSEDIGQAQLHLPWSRDDARLEQRSAMQVQLARRFPDAEWLRPFTLLDPAVPGARSGAKFIAVWREGAAIKGQLWIPLRADGGIVRARIASAFAPAPGQKPAAHADEPHPQDAASQRVEARAALIEHELTALAHAWEARHD